MSDPTITRLSSKEIAREIANGRSPGGRVVALSLVARLASAFSRPLPFFSRLEGRETPTRRCVRTRIAPWLLTENESSRFSPLTAVVLIELVQRLEPGDRRLVYRELPGDVLAGLPRGLLPGPARLPLAPALLPALGPARLPRGGRLRVAAAMMRGVLARVPAARTLPGAGPIRR